MVHSSVVQNFFHHITKTCLYSFDPLKPHFYTVKLGFTGVYIFFLISAQNIDCGYSLEPPHWGSSNEYAQSMFWAEIWKISDFLSENFPFLVEKVSLYLNRCVFVMEVRKWKSPLTWHISTQTIVRGPQRWQARGISRSINTRSLKSHSCDLKQVDVFYLFFFLLGSFVSGSKTRYQFAYNDPIPWWRYSRTNR